VPEQLGSYDDIVAGSACKLLVLLSFWVAFVVLDEVDNGGAPIGVESQNLLPYGLDQVGLCGRFLFNLHRWAVECLNEHAGWYDESLGSEFGRGICCDVVVAGDVVELQAIEFAFELPDLPVIGIHILLGAFLVFVNLLYDDFGVTISQQMLDAECDGDPETMNKSFVLGGVVGSLEK